MTRRAWGITGMCDLGVGWGRVQVGNYDHGGYVGYVCCELCFPCRWSRSRTCQQLQQDHVPLYNFKALCLAGLL